ncbi:EamA-like transporter family protein [Roseivivax jejudonensis]|uniref:EamA-like transporter family protein n=1 Tax=Roseivivax jejudonensis TaxID=1529041 RepID=A0A1X6Y8V8_9RHOB|nr:DMT family transporter [Roseivivax jejudonensis]SLN14128.1 EamA-like transporter family protein [Roseivivax jejudonensis]
MRLALLTALTMVAFAANSVLNRLAVGAGGIDPGLFGTIRLWSGALMLAGLCLVLRGRMSLGGSRRAIGVGSLLLYIYGFSAAYLALDAGLGALILFGTVQVTMAAGALAGGERPPLRRWVGTGVAFAGLVWLLWPGSGVAVSLPHGMAMAAAGLGWGIYSLAGRGAGDPLVGTAANFVLAAPLGLVIALALPGSGAASVPGIALAVVSGAITSGLGYALWYAVLPSLPASVAAVAQLTVPPIAIAGGAVLLGEVPSAEFLAASAVVLGGVALSVLPLGRR